MPHSFLTHPMFLDANGIGVHCVLTLPRGQMSTHGVLVCAPFEYAGDCAYRPLRTLAVRIAEGGRLAVRFDWPGYGDSDDLLDAAPRWTVWQDAIQEVLRQMSAMGVRTTSIVGVGIGGPTGALLVGDDPTVTGVALLAPRTGAEYVRELRAFQALSEVRAEIGVPTDTGTIAVGGYRLPPAELAALANVELDGERIGAFSSRKILIATERATAQLALVERLKSHEIEAVHAVEPELAHLTADASVSVMTRNCSLLVENWLATVDPHPAVVDVRPPTHGKRANEEPWRERSVAISVSGGELAGVTCEPRRETGDGRWVIFLNAGRIRRTGPGRLWTKFAREWSSDGVRTLRLDLAGIGESDGLRADDEVPAPYTEAWYLQPRFAEMTLAALSWLRAEEDASGFVLAGLCSGAMWAYQVALRDDSVLGAMLINPRFLPDAIPSPRARLAARAQRFAEVLPPSGRAHRARRILQVHVGQRRARILESLDTLHGRGTKLDVVFSGGDKGIGCFEQQLGTSFWATLAEHGVRVTVVDGADHTFTQESAQARLRAALGRAVAEAGLSSETFGSHHDPSPSR